MSSPRDATTAASQRPEDDAEARRAEALRVSGWGERFTFVQPHNLCFWVYLWLTGVGAFKAWSYFNSSIEFYGDAFAISVVLCVLFGGAWWLWLRHIDRWERQPVGLLVAGIVWGAVPATFAIAIWANTALLSIYPKLFGQEWAASWAAGATAPITEEAAKLCGFVLLLGLAPRLIRTANDGLILGAFIGLGFAAFEDFLYAANSFGSGFGTDPVNNGVQILTVRFASGFISHPLYSALVCCGVVYLLGTPAQPRRVGRGLGFVLTGMALHFLWDDASGFPDLGTLLAILVASVGGLALLALAFRQAAPREHQFVRDLLAPEVQAGTISAAELEAVLDKEARKAYRKTAPNRRAKKARRHLRRAVLDLTHDVAEARGADTATVEHARSEVARLRDTATSGSSNPALQDGVGSR